MTTAVPTTEYARVEAVMRDGRWRTLPEIQALVSQRYGEGAWYGECSLSARLRDLRASGLTVEREAVPSHRGLFKYRVAVEPPPGALF